MDVDHAAELLGGVILEGLGVGDAGIVDHRVDPAEGVQGGPDDRCRTSLLGHRGVAGDGLTTGADDLVDDLLGRRGRRAGTVEVATQVRYDDLGATGRQRSARGTSPHHGRRR